MKSFGARPESTAPLKNNAASSSATKSWANCKQFRAKSRNQVLTCTSSDNCVVRTRHCWPMVSCDHEDHLNELGACRWKKLLEPEQGKNTSDAQVLGKDIRYP